MQDKCQVQQSMGETRGLFEEVRPNQNKLLCQLLINFFGALLVLHLQPVLFSVGVHMRLSEESCKCKPSKYLWSDLRCIRRIRFHRNKFPFKRELSVSFESINSLRLIPPLLSTFNFSLELQRPGMWITASMNDDYSPQPSLLKKPKLSRWTGHKY